MRWMIDDVCLQTHDMILPMDVSWQVAQTHTEALRLPELGCIYGVLHNDPASLLALGEVVHDVPYKAPPRDVVLYSKPRNTHRASGQTIVAPQGVQILQIGATLGIVIGEVATRVSVDNALNHVAGYTVVNDVSVPHNSFYRPSMRFKTFDTSCVVGPWVRSAQKINTPDDLNIHVSIDGVVHSHSTQVFTRHVAQLLHDVTAFMTLQPHDVLLLGVAHPPVLANVGQTVQIEIEQIGQIKNTIVEGV